MKKLVGVARVTASSQSQFAGLWAGSVLNQFRRRGVYRALLAARIRRAKELESTRYLRVDALPTSRPILEKYGFSRVGSTWPAVGHRANKAKIHAKAQRRKGKGVLTGGNMVKRSTVGQFWSTAQVPKESTGNSQSLLSLRLCVFA